VPEIYGWFAQMVDALDDVPAYVYGVRAVTSLDLETDNERARALVQAAIDKAASPDDPELASGWCALGVITLTSDPDGHREGVNQLQRAVELYRAAGNPVPAVMILSMLAHVEDGLPAQEWARAARRTASGLNSQLADIWADLAEGAALTKRGDAASAVAMLRVAYDQIVAADFRGNIKSNVLIRLGAALAEGPATATDDAFLAGSLRQLQSDGSKFFIAFGLWALVQYLAATSRLEPAAVVLGFLEQAGVQPSSAAGQRANDAIAAHPQHLEWRTRGHRLSQDEVVAVALAALETYDQ
jgi:hypothetical protein